MAKKTDQEARKSIYKPPTFPIKKSKADDAASVATERAGVEKENEVKKTNDDVIEFKEEIQSMYSDVPETSATQAPSSTAPSE